MRKVRGLTLIELMIALAIGLGMLAGLVALFGNTSQARRELDRSGDMQESGRYALQILHDELTHAGFYGPLSSVSGTSDLPCSTDVTVWSTSLAIYVRGRNQDDTSGLFDTCLPPANIKPGTDAIFIQRASTCATTDAGCSPLANGTPYIQVSDCGDEYSTKPYVLAAANSSASPFTLMTKTCTAGTVAPIRKLIRRIFYVAPDNTLNYIDMTPGGPTAPTLVTAGVENLQLQYAIDSNNDGSPDSYSSTPAETDWPNVIGVRVWVLARSVDASPTGIPKSFTMGDYTFTPAANDFTKRHVFSSFIALATPAGMRETP